MRTPRPAFVLLAALALAVVGGAAGGSPGRPAPNDGRLSAVVHLLNER